MRDLTRGPLLGHIAAMATPIAVGMLVQTLYLLVDLYFVSRLGDVALAGASAAGNAMFLVLALCQILSVGTLAVVSHAVGADDQRRASLAFNQAILLAGILGTATFLGGYLGLADLYIGSIGADPETVAEGKRYLRWVIPSMAFQFATAAMSAALQGTGVVKPAMVVQFFGLLLNTILTPILIAGWGTGHAMGVAGAGLASTLAAFASVLMMIYYFARLERYVKFDPASLRPNWRILRRMLGIGLPSGAEFILLFVYMAVIYTVIGHFGPAAQAGFGAGSRVMQAILLPSMAIAFAAPAIAGQNFGARNADRVRRTFATAATLNVAIMAGCTALCQWRPEWLVQQFSSDAEVLAVATVFMTTISWNFIPNALNLTSSAMFQALGNTVPGLIASATRIVTFVVPAFWLERQPGFYIEQVWYLSVGTVLLQAMISLILLRGQFARRLKFDKKVSLDRHGD